jgi:hypothetical protein
MVLITAHRGQHQQEPDLGLCWYQIHELLGEWLQLQSESYDPVVHFVVEDFQTLLKRKGLGPMHKLEQKAIESHFLVADLHENLEKMMWAVLGKEWPDTAERQVDNQWGRRGFQVRASGKMRPLGTPACSSVFSWMDGIIAQNPWIETAARTLVSFSISARICIQRQQFPRTSSW